MAGDRSQNYLPHNLKRLFLTKDGALLVAEKAPALIPDLSKDEIVDRSKASSIAKVIICIQTLWFCPTVLTRLASSFSISLLELNTFAHAICTLLLYYLWWDKPLDIKEPTILQDQKDEAQCLFAAMSMCSQIGLVRKCLFSQPGASRMILGRHVWCTLEPTSNPDEVRCNDGLLYSITRSNSLARRTGITDQTSQDIVSMRDCSSGSVQSAENEATQESITQRSHPTETKNLTIRRGD
jgi:hypothetical protein